MQQADRQTAEQKDLLLDFPQHLRPGLPPATGEERPPKTNQTQTETETFLATATHQEEPSLPAKTATLHDVMLDIQL